MNLLSAILAVSAIAFYVIVYTILLKRNTPQNIVIGGAAGAAPVLIGWAAVTNTVGAPAWVMFAIVFLWTPPHFWALAMRYRDDYAAAGVPMLPVVRGDRSTTLQILVYSVVLVVVDARAVARRRARCRVRRRRRRARRRVPLPRGAAALRADGPDGVRLVQVLDDLSGAALRGDRRRPADVVTVSLIGVATASACAVMLAVR